MATPVGDTGNTNNGGTASPSLGSKRTGSEPVRDMRESVPDDVVVATDPVSTPLIFPSKNNRTYRSGFIELMAFSNDFSMKNLQGDTASTLADRAKNTKAKGPAPTFNGEAGEYLANIRGNMRKDRKIPGTKIMFTAILPLPLSINESTKVGWNSAPSGFNESVLGGANTASAGLMNFGVNKVVDYATGDNADALSSAVATGSQYVNKQVKSVTGFDALDMAGRMVDSTSLGTNPVMEKFAGSNVSYHDAATNSVAGSVVTNPHKDLMALGGSTMDHVREAQALNGRRQLVMDVGYWAQFQGVTPREFSLKWSIIPENHEDAMNGLALCARLKEFSLPENVSGVEMLSPHYWQINFSNPLVQSQLLYGNLVITSIDLNFMENGEVHLSGTPKKFDITITFQEVKAPSAALYKKVENEDYWLISNRKGPSTATDSIGGVISSDSGLNRGGLGGQIGDNGGVGGSGTGGIGGGGSGTIGGIDIPIPTPSFPGAPGGWGDIIPNPEDILTDIIGGVINGNLGDVLDGIVGGVKNKALGALAGLIGDKFGSVIGGIAGNIGGILKGVFGDYTGDLIADIFTGAAGSAGAVLIDAVARGDFDNLGEKLKEAAIIGAAGVGIDAAVEVIGEYVFGATDYTLQKANKILEEFGEQIGFEFPRLEEIVGLPDLSALETEATDPDRVVLDAEGNPVRIGDIGPDTPGAYEDDNGNWVLVLPDDDSAKAPSEVQAEVRQSELRDLVEESKKISNEASKLADNILENKKIFKDMVDKNAPKAELDKLHKIIEDDIAEYNKLMARNALVKAQIDKIVGEGKSNASKNQEYIKEKEARRDRHFRLCKLNGSSTAELSKEFGSCASLENQPSEPTAPSSNIDPRAPKAASYATRNAKPSGVPVGQCAKYVRLALASQGLKPSGGNPASAYMYHSQGVLKKMGFTEIPSSNIQTPQAGDIVVFDAKAPANTTHGHIQIYDGTTKKWVSDFVQRGNTMTTNKPLNRFSPSQYHVYRMYK